MSTSPDERSPDELFPTAVAPERAPEADPVDQERLDEALARVGYCQHWWHWLNLLVFSLRAHDDRVGWAAIPAILEESARDWAARERLAITVTQSYTHEFVMVTVRKAR